jgi:hypothetical protein
MTKLTDDELMASLDVPAPEFPPRHVVESLVRVVRDLPAIGKDEKMAGESGGYKYRGIEQMTAAAQPLFGRHGIIACPRVLESVTTPITKGNKPWVHREMRVEYVLRGVNGPDDFVVMGPFVVEADDNSDKSANKCMTQAFKQMLLQVLMISDRKDDPDEANVGRDAAPEVSETVGNDLATPTYRKAQQDGYTAAELDMVASEVVGRAVVLADVLRTEWAAVRDAWIVYRQENPKDATPPAEASVPDMQPGEPFIREAKAKK